MCAKRPDESPAFLFDITIPGADQVLAGAPRRGGLGRLGEPSPTPMEIAFSRPDLRPRLLRLTARLDDSTAGVFNSPMHKFIRILSCAILLAGCASPQTTAPKGSQAKPAPAKPIITPDFRPVGKVAMVNPDGRFVVLSFPPGEAPKPEALLNVYRNGLKVAEVKVDGKYQNGNNLVADIITGEVHAGDEARQD